MNLEQIREHVGQAAEALARRRGHREYEPKQRNESINIGGVRVDLNMTRVEVTRDGGWLDLYGMSNADAHALLGQNVYHRERGQTQLLGTVNDVEWSARAGELTVATVRFIRPRREGGVRKRR